MQEEVQVSICCIMYNQSEYIENTLIGFLEQITSFKYEIIVCDDHSSDDPSILIENLQQQYPDRIKYIRHECNLGANKNAMKCIEQATGKYIALCEGDDYWIAEDKLQLQFDALEKFPNINFCVSNALCVNDLGEIVGEIKPRNIDHFSTLKDVLASSWQFSATASYFMRSSMIDKIPTWFLTSSIGDLYIELIMGKNGIYVIDKNTVAYRQQVTNSWSSQINKKPTPEISEHYDNFIDSLNLLKIENLEFQECFDMKINEVRISKANVYLKRRDFKEYIKSYKYVVFKSNMKTIRKIQYLITKPLVWIVYANLNTK